VQIQEASNNVTLLSSTGAADGNTVPTQFAVTGYVAAQLGSYSTSATIAASYQPLSSNLTGLGANNAAYYLARANHTGTQAASTITGLGTAAPLDVAASGNASSTQVVKGSDTRLSDSRTPTAHNQAFSTITATPTTLVGYGITDAVGAGDSRLTDARTPTTHNQAWSTITGTPTTLSGYGITDGFTEASVRATPLTGFTSGAGTITATDSVLTAIQKLNGNVAASGTGSVTSVGLSLPNLFTVTGSPVTTSGTLSATLATQTANSIWAGPSTGSAAADGCTSDIGQSIPIRGSLHAIERSNCGP
jgi:hypothetical protein